MTNKQKAFVDEYLVDLNATQAAIRAGYTPTNADNIGGQLMAKSRVAEAIARAMAERSRRTGVTADRVVNELAKIAFSNIYDIVDVNYGLVKGDASRDDRAAIQSVKVKNSDIGVEREVRLYDKLRALEQLGRHLGLFNDKFKLDGNVQIIFSGEDQLQ